MKRLLQISIILLVVYSVIHILFGLDFNPLISLVTRITQAILALFLLIYIIKFTDNDNKSN